MSVTRLCPNKSTFPGKGSEGAERWQRTRLAECANAGLFSSMYELLRMCESTAFLSACLRVYYCLPNRYLL